MQPYYIGCDVEPVLQSTFPGSPPNVVCLSGGTSLTEAEAAEIFATPRMDQEDFQIVGNFAAYMLLVALGVKLIRKILGN